MKGEKVFIDGNDIGRIEPGNVLSMVPTAGRHEIRVKQTSLSIELRECTPYYVRIFQENAGRKSYVEIRVMEPNVGEEETRDLWEIRNKR